VADIRRGAEDKANGTAEPRGNRSLLPPPPPTQSLTLFSDGGGGGRGHGLRSLLLVVLVGF